MEAEHVGPENIIHHGQDHTALNGLRLVVGRLQDCGFVICSFRCLDRKDDVSRSVSQSIH